VLRSESVTRSKRSARRRSVRHQSSWPARRSCSRLRRSTDSSGLPKLETRRNRTSTTTHQLESTAIRSTSLGPARTFRSRTSRPCSSRNDSARSSPMRPRSVRPAGRLSSECRMQGDAAKSVPGGKVAPSRRGSCRHGLAPVVKSETPHRRRIRRGSRVGGWNEEGVGALRLLLGDALLPDAGALSLQSLQVVDLGPTDMSVLEHFEAVDRR